MIPDEAVEAAVDALVMTRMGDYNIEMSEFCRAARAALEAAAPHMQGAAWDEGYLVSKEAVRQLDPTNPYRSQA